MREDGLPLEEGSESEYESDGGPDTDTRVDRETWYVFCRGIIYMKDLEDYGRPMEDLDTVTKSYSDEAVNKYTERRLRE